MKLGNVFTGVATGGVMPVGDGAIEDIFYLATFHFVACRKDDEDYACTPIRQERLCR